MAPESLSGAAASLQTAEGTLLLALSPVRGHYSWHYPGAEMFGLSSGKGRSALQPPLWLCCPFATEIALSLLGKKKIYIYIFPGSNSCLSPGQLSIPVRMDAVTGPVKDGASMNYFLGKRKGTAFCRAAR